MNEDTVIRYMPLAPGTRPWRWHADANLVVLCSSLDENGREEALSDLQAHWRREGLRVVTDEAPDAEPEPCPNATIPLTQLPTGLLTVSG